MANNFSASKAKYWSRRMQRKHHRTDVYRAFASFEEQSTLKSGTVVDRPTKSNVRVRTLGSDGSYSTQDLTDASETLTIDQEKYAAFYVKDLDVIQHNYKVINEYADDSAVKLGNRIDGSVLAEVANATSVVDAASLGGTSGEGIALSTSNVAQIVTLAAQKLDLLRIEQSNRAATISPHFKRTLVQSLGDKESALGDKTTMNGHVGEYFDFILLMSNSLYWTGELAMATQPTDGDTVVINGVTFTFKTTLGSTAGNVLIGASADAARANLTALINAPETTTAQGVAFTNQDTLELLTGVTAANNDTTNVMTITAEGWGYVTVSETFTDATDTWTAAKQIQHNMFCRKGWVDVVIQKYPNLVTKDVSGKLGKDIVTWTAFGKKTFTEGKDMVVDVKIRTDNF